MPYFIFLTLIVSFVNLGFSHQDLYKMRCICNSWYKIIVIVLDQLLPPILISARTWCGNNCPYVERNHFKCLYLRMSFSLLPE